MLKGRMSSLINNGSLCSNLSEKESILTILICSYVLRVKYILHAPAQTSTQYGFVSSITVLFYFI